ncbi:MAG: hypothetical protein JNG84_11935, partial [Archangium sp.]|nr:hypothetical protein [Archangium sp.]
DAMKARGTDVRVVKDTKVNDTITTKDARGVSVTHDLATPEGAMSFALTLGLPSEQTQKIANVLTNLAGTDIRDEVAQMAQMWAVAERGGQAPSRLVLSGHHVGSAVYGEENGRLEWPLLAGLAEAMPRGARSVEDLLIAACYSGGESSMEKYQAMFPNLKTAVAYAGSSPGAASGATVHQQRWEKATRGARDDIQRTIFDNSRKGENVTVWTKAHGYQSNQAPRSIEDLRTDQQRGQSTFNDAFNGAPIASSQSGPVRDFYNATQRLIQNPTTPAEERVSLEAVRDQTIRLLYYAPVSKRFGEVYGAKATQAFTALGLPAPDFKTLSRADALTAIKSFQDALAAAPPPPPAAASSFAGTLEQFKALDPKLIPDTWV